MNEISNIYTLNYMVGFQIVNFRNEDIYLPEDLLKLVPYGRDSIFRKRIKLKEIWKPLDITFDRYFRGRLRSNPDISCYHSILVLSEKAIGVLKDLIPESVEILPVNNIFSLKKYYFLNFTSDLDCLIDKAIYEDGLVITNIEKYDFNYDVIKSSHFFKIRKVPTEIYVSDVFVKRVLDNKLKAFEFRPIFSKNNKYIEENIYSSKITTWYFKK